MVLVNQLIFNALLTFGKGTYAMGKYKVKNAIYSIKLVMYIHKIYIRYILLTLHKFNIKSSKKQRTTINHQITLIFIA